MCNISGLVINLLSICLAITCLEITALPCIPTLRSKAGCVERQKVIGQASCTFLS